MHNYKKLRLIRKGLSGFQFMLLGMNGVGFTPTTAGSVLDQGIIDKIKLSQTNIWQLQQKEQEALRQANLLKLLENIYSVASLATLGITNLGITSGSTAIANLGQLGTILGGGLLLYQNWGNMSPLDRKANVAGLGGTFIDTLDNSLFTNLRINNSGLTTRLNMGYDSISNAVSMAYPVAGVFMKSGKFASDTLGALGGSTDQMTKTDLALDSTPFRLLTLGVNGFLGKRSKDFSTNQDTINKVGNSYGGSVATINNAQSKANKKYGLFSGGERGDANALIDRATALLDIMTNISNEYQDLLANKSDLAYTRYNMDINGGYLQLYIRAAKDGAILERILLRKHRTGGLIHERINVDTKEIEWQPIINLETKEETPKFKEGGELTSNESNLEWQPIINLETLILVMAEGGKSEEKLETKEETTLKNVIPEGALHARKHNMEHAEELTKKGIPVVDNKGEQLAEIERNEIILNLLLTKLLEEMLKKYSSNELTLKEKDEIALEAGKILVHEILHNTEDRTGLIKECKKGGVLDEHK